MKKTGNIPAFILHLLAVVLMLGVSSVPATPMDKPGEYEIKTAYLYNFARLTDWPAEVFAGDTAPLVICAFGKNLPGSEIDSLGSKSVRNRKLVVRHVSRIEGLQNCHILYIAASEKARLAHILASVNTPGVLTVSDIKNFTEAGGMIGLVQQENKIRFRINLKSAQRAELKLSSQMLKLAQDIIE